MKTAAIYARVSSDRQKEEQTIASQTSALRVYATEHEYVVWLTSAGVPTRTGQPGWNTSTVWTMLRNSACQGLACFQKTMQAERRRVTRRLRQRGGIAARAVCKRPRPREEWIEIPVPALISSTQFALAQERFEQNRRFAARRTKRPSLLQGVLVCHLCGYAFYRSSSRTARHEYLYYRCAGTDIYRNRFPPGRRCANRPVRQDALDTLVWEEVIRLLANPALVRAEIDRRLAELRASHPVDVKRDVATKELTRLRASITRLIEAYQEQLVHWTSCARACRPSATAKQRSRLSSPRLR
jgi:site-specific DNA recombinase